jgi:hypothetical protein
MSISREGSGECEDEVELMESLTNRIKPQRGAYRINEMQSVMPLLNKHDLIGSQVNQIKSNVKGTLKGKHSIYKLDNLKP